MYKLIKKEIKQLKKTLYYPPASSSMTLSFVMFPFLSSSLSLPTPVKTPMMSKTIVKIIQS